MNTIVAFQQSIATANTPVQLPSNPVQKAVTIAALASNTAPVVIGNASSVSTSSGFVLGAGQQVTIEMPGGNTDSLFAVSSAAGSSFSVIGA